MKRFRKFLNDLREPLGIGMKRLMIALTIILGIVIVTVAGWLLWSRIGMAYARNKVSDTYLQNQPAYQYFVADRDDYAYVESNGNDTSKDLWAAKNVQCDVTNYYLHAVGRTDGDGR